MADGRSHEGGDDTQRQAPRLRALSGGAPEPGGTPDSATTESDAPDPTSFARPRSGAWLYVADMTDTDINAETVTEFPVLSRARTRALEPLRLDGQDAPPAPPAGSSGPPPDDTAEGAMEPQGGGDSGPPSGPPRGRGGGRSGRGDGHGGDDGDDEPTGEDRGDGDPGAGSPDPVTVPPPWRDDPDETATEIGLESGESGPEARSRDAPGHPGRVRKILVRVATGLVFGAVAIVIVLLGTAWFAGLVTVLLAIAGIEYFEVLQRARTPEAARRAEETHPGGRPHPALPPASLVGLVSIVLAGVLAYLHGVDALAMVVAAGVVLSVLWFVPRPPVRPGDPPLAAAESVSGIVHIGLLGSFAMLTLRLEHGIGLLVTVVILTICLDIGAYTVGNTIGRRPFAPSVSPNKTVEGFLGAVAVVAVATVVIVLLSASELIDALHEIEFLRTPGAMAALAILVVAAGTVGDLAESVIKRSLGVKDMGSFLPGHGGFFDRFDAMLFVLPCAYAVFLLAGVQEI